MARTFIRPETQIKTLDTFDDQVAAGSALETTTWNLEQFLGGCISQLNRFLNTTVSGNNWYADLTAPTTFESGAVRGIDDLNQDLHDFERKRVLRGVQSLVDVTVPAAVKATGTLTLVGNAVEAQFAIGTLTLTANVQAGDQVRTGTKTYTFTSPLGAGDGDVLLGATKEDSIDNLVSAINNAPGGAGMGVLWAAATTANGFVSAVRNLATMEATALTAGSAGNSIVTTDPTDTGSVMSWGGGTLAGGANAETVTIGTKTYTWTDPVGASDGDVLVGATAGDSLDNLIAAIVLGAGSGTKYAAATTLHPTVTAAAGSGDTMDATAKLFGTAGNLIATTDTMAAGSWGAAKLAGGAGDLVILNTGELPAQTTAAVGAVTTLGTVVAYEANFESATLTEVSGSSAINPKNMVGIVDGDTRDPILADGKEVWALLQSEDATNPHTITDTTPERVQLTFVVLTAEGNDLEIVDGQYMGGKVINYMYTERVPMIGLNEQDFLRGAAIDIGAGAVTPTRQNAYDNQGGTPVDVSGYNAILDLESTGNYWRIRDEDENEMLTLTTNSGTSATTVALGSNVDYFDVNAADNNFLNGIKVDTGAAGTTINVGVTANQIDSGGALTVTSGGSGDLKLASVDELIFEDGYFAGSGYDTPLVLSDSSAEWDDFETAFGGEVSLLKAITMASSMAARHRAVAHVTSAINADVLIEGPGGPGSANISADLLDYRTQTFVDDVEIFINGQLMRNGANAAANFDVYPSAVAVEQQYGCFYAEFQLKASPGNPDVIQMFISGTL